MTTQNQHGYGSLASPNHDQKKKGVTCDDSSLELAVGTQISSKNLNLSRCVVFLKRDRMQVPNNCSADQRCVNEFAVNASVGASGRPNFQSTSLVRCLTIGEPIEKENTDLERERNSSATRKRRNANCILSLERQRNITCAIRSIRSSDKTQNVWFTSTHRKQEHAILYDHNRNGKHYWGC